MYYLNSRYYNPEWGRFINTDAYASTGQGMTGANMFAYCGNNPITRRDISGCFWETFFDIVSLVSSVDDVHDAAKAVDRIDDAVDATKIANKVDFYVTPNGEAIPATLDGFNNNLSKLEIVNGKYVGKDSRGPIRVISNDIHLDKPNFAGPSNPLHTKLHFYIERKAKGCTGVWYHSFTGPMEMLK